MIKPQISALFLTIELYAKVTVRSKVWMTLPLSRRIYKCFIAFVPTREKDNVKDLCFFYITMIIHKKQQTIGLNKCTIFSSWLSFAKHYWFLPKYIGACRHMTIHKLLSQVIVSIASTLLIASANIVALCQTKFS